MQAQPALVYLTYLVIAIVVCLVLFVRFRSMRRTRPLRLERLWFVPALYTVFTATLLYQFAPAGIQWLYVAIALSVGGALGWRHGALMRISVDPATHLLNQQASPAAMLLLLVLIVARQGLRIEAPTMGFSPAFLADLLVVFALGLFTATRLEMFLRARRLLGEIRAKGRSADA